MTLGMLPGQCLSRHIAALVEAGFVSRRDSPNGKRYARKDNDGAINDAFEFSLAPLLARANEIEERAAEVDRERFEVRKLRERLTICRRDIAKLIEIALEEGVAGNWDSIHEHYRRLVASVPRVATVASIAPIAEEMEMLREEISNLLEVRGNAQILNGNRDQTERHIQKSNPESTQELEAGSGNAPGAKRGSGDEVRHDPIKPVPLGMVMRACPTISDYGPGGTVGSWRDLMAAAIVVSLRGDGAAECGGGHGLHPGAGRAYQLSRRLPSRTDRENTARRVFARAGAHGTVASADWQRARKAS